MQQDFISWCNTIQQKQQLLLNRQIKQLQNNSYTMKTHKNITPQGQQSINNVKHIASLQQIFSNQRKLAWQLLDCQSSLYSQTDTSMQKITYLTSLYMIIIQKLNSIQDQRQTYFTFKMQKLMHEPYIIRSFNSEINHKKVALQNKKKELQRKIEQEADRQNHYKVIEIAMNAQQQKQKKINSKIKSIINESNKNLQERIKKRSELRQNRFSPNKYSSNISNSSDSSNKKGNQNNSNEFQLTIDENDNRINRMKKQIQDEERFQAYYRKLKRTNSSLPSQEQQQ